MAKKQNKSKPGKRSTTKKSPRREPEAHTNAGRKKSAGRAMANEAPRARRPPTKIRGRANRQSSVERTDFEADMNAREELLEGSLDQVQAIYVEALEEGVYFPVVFLVDCEDVLGGKLARDWVGREEVDEAIEANQAASNHALTTTFAQALSFRDCQETVPLMFPYLQGTFQQAPPEGTFIVVVVACGGAATFFAPIETRG